VAIIGPAGLQGILDSMVAFTNRRYPVITVTEVGQKGDKRIRVVDVESFRVYARPIRHRCQVNYPCP
jgi:hypothetical protein